MFKAVNSNFKSLLMILYAIKTPKNPIHATLENIKKELLCFIEHFVVTDRKIDRNKLSKYSKARPVAQSINDYITEFLNIP